MKIINELTKTWDDEGSTKKRYITLLSCNTGFIVVKLDVNTGMEGSISNSARAYFFDDEKKANMWVNKLSRDMFL